MPILIKELISSDTISQGVDKINFNFDQILLNGGGPAGPRGLFGPTGPGGGRGIKGSSWYDGNDNPNELIIVGINTGDYFLQSNGLVWQYNGTVWTSTLINLSGPIGPIGSSVGFNYVGGYNGINQSPASIDNQNVAFVPPMPNGINGGANQLTNQGVSTVLIGGIGSTAISIPGITYTNAYQISNQMIAQLDSSLLSLLIHQKDSTASSIVFMGGGVNPNDNYEQFDLSKLSNISLGADDSLNLNVRKGATNPTNLSDLIGLNINTILRGQQFRAGKHINFISGTDQNLAFVGEISDISFTVNTSNPQTPAKFSVLTTSATGSTLFQLGGSIIINETTIRTGNALIEAGSIGIIANTNIKIGISALHGLNISPSNLIIRGNTGPVQLITTALQNIVLTSANNINISAVGLIRIAATSDIDILSNKITVTGLNQNASHVVIIDNTTINTGGIKVKGNIVWHSTLTTALPAVTTHRNITINKSTSLELASAPVYLADNRTTVGRSLMIDIFKGSSYDTATEYNRLYTASTSIKNTGNTAVFVGHTVENESVQIQKDNVGYKLIGIDRSSGNTNLQTRFNATEDTTEVHNRIQYVGKTLNINPLSAGITGNYTIPATFMDCSFLDISIGWDGLGFPADNMSSNDISILIPDGLYSGQRFNIHLIAARMSATYSAIDDLVRSWPNDNGGSAYGVGSVSLIASNWKNASSTIIASLPIPIDTANVNNFNGVEFYIELIWIGRTYNTAEQQNLGGTTVFDANRGWMVVNGTDVISGGAGNSFVSKSNINFTN
jgi:hypothetical protein